MYNCNVSLKNFGYSLKAFKFIVECFFLVLSLLRESCFKDDLVWIMEFCVGSSSSLSDGFYFLNSS